MSLDRYFWTAPSEQSTSSIKELGPRAVVAYIIFFIYSTAGFALYTLAWRPLLQPDSAIPHRATVFLIEIWISVTGSSLIFIVWHFYRSKIMERKLGKEAVKIGRELYIIETALQEQLANFNDDSKNYSPSVPNHSHDDESGLRREILWEKYDLLLD
jgi:hypothetical protein